jgi:dihydrofolate reductase
MIVSLIVATPINLAIGKNNQLIWNLPKDMKFFMETTTGHPVIMGRKNYESIPKKFRPLKNRTNVIITRNKKYAADGCIVVNSIEDSIKVLEKENYEEVFVIGGGEIYKRFLENNLIDRMYITHIEQAFDGDTFFPKVDFSQWASVTIMTHVKDEENPHNFKVIQYEKKKIKLL